MGLVVVPRNGQCPGKENLAKNVFVTPPVVESDTYSSTLFRNEINRNPSLARSIVGDAVYEYVVLHGLYGAKRMDL